MNVWNARHTDAAAQARDFTKAVIDEEGTQYFRAPPGTSHRRADVSGHIFEAAKVKRLVRQLKRGKVVCANSKWDNLYPVTRQYIELTMPPNAVIHFLSNEEKKAAFVVRNIARLPSNKELRSS